MALSKEQAILEYAKCVKNTPYALRTYLQTYDNTQSKYVPLDLFHDQIRLIEDYDNHEENIALKYRQAGVSTITSAWVSKRLVFASKTKGRSTTCGPKRSTCFCSRLFFSRFCESRSDHVRLVSRRVFRRTPGHRLLHRFCHQAVRVQIFLVSILSCPA